MSRIRALGILAGLVPALVGTADVVYVNPPDLLIPSGINDPPLSLDVNFDGTWDVEFAGHYEFGVCGPPCNLSWYGVGADGVVAGSGVVGELTSNIPVTPGDAIGPDRTDFTAIWPIMLAWFGCPLDPCERRYDGYWINPGATGFIGIKFWYANASYYGWIRVENRGGWADFTNFYILDYAFETTPNVAIIAGDMGEPTCTPRFFDQPDSQAVLEGSPVALSVIAVGEGLTYQWYRRGVALTDDGRISGSTTRTLTIDAAQPGDTGAYHVVVDSTCGPSASETAYLSVERDCTPLPGNLVVLDGSGTVRVPDSPDVDLSTAGTIEFWMWPTVECYYTHPVGKSDDLECYTDRSYEVWYDAPNRLVFVELFFADRLGCGAALAAYDIDWERWHHVAVTYNSTLGIARLLVNGVVADETTTDRFGIPLVGRAINNSSVPLDIGGSGYYADFIGRIDEVRLWNIARTPEEIGADYRRVIDPGTPGLVAYYRFDEGQGTVVHDLTGRGHDGELRNGAGWATANPCPACDPDVNCDGSANGFDIEVMERAVGGDFGDFCRLSADFNGDGSVDGLDVEAVESVVGGGPCP